MSEFICGHSWPNGEIPGLPHRCVIVPGWHVRHCCHCGAARPVVDCEQAHPPMQHSGADSDSARRSERQGAETGSVVPRDTPGDSEACVEPL